MTALGQAGAMVDTATLQRLVDPKDPDLLRELGGVEGLGKMLGTDLTRGLTDAQVKDLREKYGSNVLPDLPSKSFLTLVMEGFEDKTLIMLMIAACISLVLGVRENPSSGWIEGAAIVMAVLLVVLVTAANDYEKELQFRKLNAKKEMKEVSVVRDGVRVQVMVDELVVGDIVVIETGDILAVDGVYVSGSNLACDESGATGESDLIKKGPTCDVFFLSGTQVMDGIGRFVVTAVGVSSFHGKTMMSLRVEQEDTPLQQKLGRLADDIGFYGLLAATATIVCLTAQELFVYYWNGRALDAHFLSTMVRFVITGITILVVAIPEGLPLAVTMALAYSMVKMLGDNNLVRRLDACETMGRATNICSDKTGTLTQNKMTVVEGYVARLHFTTGNSEEVPLVNRLHESVAKVIIESVEINSTAYQPPGSKFVGSKTESALLEFTRALGGDYERSRNGADVVAVNPFSSLRKCMSTLIRNGEGLRLLVKGAAELTVEKCSHQLLANGDVVELTQEMKEDTMKAIETMADQALRTIALAHKDTPAAEAGGSDAEYVLDHESSDYVLVGVLGIRDPIRPEVPEAVMQCKKAGIKVRMVTGDNLTAAKEIARSCSILTPDGLCMEGPTFRLLEGQELKNTVFKLEVLARSSPMDKQILVATLKELDEVVAVTGDGTNDGPALKLAHVGFSMGVTGTEVAKEASDIVLMDDNFASITKAISWGRNVFDAIRKFIQFQLTVNIVAVALAFLGSITSKDGESPLKPVQLLWVNLIMDTLAALALATERPSPSLLKRPPYCKTMPLVSDIMWRNIIGQAMFQLVLTLLALCFPNMVFGPPAGPGTSYGDPQYHGLHLTMLFNLFVMCQLFNEINSRKVNGELNVFAGLLDNPLFLGVMAFTVVMQVILVQFGGDWVGCTPLTKDQWIRTTALGALGLPLGLILSRINPPRRWLRKTSGKQYWQRAIAETRTKIRVVEQFRRKRSIDTFYPSKT